MRDPFETWLHERWQGLSSREDMVAETAWNECEKQQQAEVERLTAHVVNYRTAGKVTDDVIERLEAENERLTAEHLADLERIKLLTDGLREQTDAADQIERLQDSLYKADKEHAALCEIHKSDQDEIERLWERLRNQRDTFVAGLEEGE